MLVAICLASSIAPRESLQKIPETAADAREMYETLSRATELEFDHYSSCCLVDPSRLDAYSILSRTASLLGPNDTLLIYYSGHGVLQGARLHVCFSDCADQGRGMVTINEVGEWVGHSKAQVLVVLDCCHSGAALELANARDPYQAVQISVLASGDVTSRSTTGAAGSTFTKGLCAAINQLRTGRLRLSVVKLAEIINASGAPLCTLNLRQGKEDLILPRSDVAREFQKDFSSRFMHLAFNSPAHMREVLWYSLISVPVDIRLEILRLYSDTSANEPSWVVRRSIGSVLHSCRESSEGYWNLIEGMLSGSNWMEQCIGLIGARNLLSEKSLQERAISILTSQNRMDVVWLAHLYLSDNKAITLDNALRTRLAETAWGLTDMANRWILPDQQSGVSDSAVSKLVNSCATAELRTALGTHLRCCGLHTPMILSLPYDPELVNSALVKHLYKAGRRGRTSDALLKWLFSAIYGSWRDQVQEDPIDWLRNTTVEIGRSQLAICARIPAVELRMAVFQSFVGKAEQVSTYRESLLWGLKDVHPWVRRVAVSALRYESVNLTETIEKPTDAFLYPGVLDLLLELFRAGFKISLSSEDQLTAVEKEALERGFALEQRMI